MRSKILILACLLFSIYSQGQDLPAVIDYSEKSTFNIGGVEVEGAETRDRNAIKSITGLRVGKEISIPGDDIPSAIKALLRLRLFEDVQIIQDKMEDGLIYLTILLVLSLIHI